jgi:hypothetical protein
MSELIVSTIESCFLHNKVESSHSTLSYAMSNSTDRPSSSRRRAARNPYRQTVINNTLAVFLADHNLPVPDSLKRPAQGEDRRLRSNKRRKHLEHENHHDVRSQFLFS